MFKNWKEKPIEMKAINCKEKTYTYSKDENNNHDLTLVLLYAVAVAAVAADAVDAVVCVCFTISPLDVARYFTCCKRMEMELHMNNIVKWETNGQTDRQTDSIGLNSKILKASTTSSKRFE